MFLRTMIAAIALCAAASAANAENCMQYRPGPVLTAQAAIIRVCLQKGSVAKRRGGKWDSVADAVRAATLAA
jgi:hypothetical protein